MHDSALKLTKLMLGLAFTAALIYAVKHAWYKTTDVYSFVPLVLALAAITIGEVVAWHNAALHWFERNAGSCFSWIIVGAMCSFGVLYTNFSASSASNDTRAGIQKAAFDVGHDFESTEKEKSRKVAELQKRLEMKPIRTPEAARVDQDKAKAHRFWKLTDGCKATKGPQTREFCSDYASAVADESMATRALQDEAELKIAEKELKEVREERRKAGSRAVSEDQAGLLSLARLGNVDLAEARTIDSMIVPWIIQFILVIGGISLAYHVCRHMERKAWVDWAKWLRRLALARDVLLWRRGIPDYVAPEPQGRPEASQPAPTQTSVSVRQPSIIEAYRQHCRAYGVAPVAT